MICCDLDKRECKILLGIIKIWTDIYRVNIKDAARLKDYAWSEYCTHELEMCGSIADEIKKDAGKNLSSASVNFLLQNVISPQLVQNTEVLKTIVTKIKMLHVATA